MKELLILSKTYKDRRYGEQDTFFREIFSIRDKYNLPINIFVCAPVYWKYGSKKLTVYTFNKDFDTWVKLEKKINSDIIVYDRFFSETIDERIKAKDFREFLIQNKLKFITNYSVCKFLENKLDFHNFLLKNNLATLESYNISEYKRSDLNQIISKLFEYNDTIYIKPIFGSGGVGISICQMIDKNNFILKTDKEIINFENLTDATKEFKKRFYDSFLIQSKAKIINLDHCHYDMRVIVQKYGFKYKITGMGIRLSKKDGFVSNLKQGGEGIALEDLECFFINNYKKTYKEIKKEISKKCLKCCRKLEKKFGSFGEISFDVLLTTDKGIVIIEGNSKPARAIFNSIANKYPVNSLQYNKYKKIRENSILSLLNYVKNNNKFNLFYKINKLINKINFLKLIK